MVAALLSFRYRVGEPMPVWRTLLSVDDDDAGLWTRVRQGDEVALAALFDRHEARLFRHASRLLTHREDAKDAVTVAFFELWRKRVTVRLVDGSPLPWLLTTVAHCARNLERSSRRYRALLDRAPVAEAVPSAGHDDSGVLSALKRLPEREQAVVVLSVLEGYAEREVAEALGIPAGTVKSRLARAKAKLRDELALEGVRA
ncbi:RNA polymerase sigma factor [Microbacterium sp. Leaf151]|uniref:RNA polymerase sigma factor n=1 Tax=Microbacterium sp. Leaf151 TaxID=1736276 RepID=UPI0009E923ED|nr:sigma-70 family RNA polymerase sigma factor [Microbacterium sp. Leaf151]